MITANAVKYRRKTREKAGRGENEEEGCVDRGGEERDEESRGESRETEGNL